jgi:PAS domain S-box-containing protein
MLDDITNKTTRPDREYDDLEMLDLVTQHMAAALTRCGRDLRYIWANQAYADWIKRPLHDLVGRPIADVLGKTAFEELLPHFRRVLTGEKVHYEQEVNFQSIGKRWISVTYTPTLAANKDPSGWVAVTLDITERKRTEQALHESEQRFRLVADSAPVMIWMSGTDKLCTYFNKPWLDFTGRSIEKELGNGWAEGVHPEDLERCLDTYTQSFDRREKFEMEYRLRRQNGEFRWILDIGVPRFNQDRSFAGYIGIGVDVSERKQAERSLADMTRKLIEAQEQERARIARELHDDINQQLALLQIEMEQLRNNPSEVGSRVLELEKRTDEISRDVQALSCELHSSRLEYLGAVVAMKSWCTEFGQRQRMQIDYGADVRSKLSPEVGLCLFRVLQEALHNAAKHSAVKWVEVQLTERSGEVHLIVKDLGKGFDTESARRGRGLGLTSMQERVRLVNGTIMIESKPMGGTTIHVRVPLGLEQVSELAAG